MTSGRVTTITPDRRGDTLLTATGTGTTVLEVEDTTDFDEGGGWLVIADSAPIAYTGLDDDAGTVDLAAPVGAVFEAGLPIDLWDPTVPPTGAKVVEYVASVDVDHGVVPGVTIPHELVPSAGVDNLVDASVELAEDGDGAWYIAQVYGREPVVDLSTADASTLDVDALPALPTTDGDAPDNAPTVTSIGGIGSMFFRWTEITNADPVTYRLHVRAGSAPTTDGTYEVAAGVGLTSAAVRKLKDGTAIVADGSVTYYAIVTVEDADGPGPASAVVSGVPAQVNTADINVNALTAGMLTANDVLADAINATDLTGTTVTGATLRTAATGERVIVRNDSGSGVVEFFAGVTGETATIMDPNTTILGSDPTTEMPGVNLWTGTSSTANVQAKLSMWTGKTGGSANDTQRSNIQLDATSVNLGDLTGTGPTLKLNPNGVTFASGAVQVPTLTATTGISGTMTTGSVGTGTFRDSVRAAIIGDYAAAWTAYTPTFTAATTNPTLANFTRSGRYIQRGKTVDFIIVITSNAASGYGTGAYEIGLPVAARATNEVVVHGSQSGPNHMYIGRNDSNTTGFNLHLTSTDAVMNSTTSGMANGTVIRITGTYEAA